MMDETTKAADFLRDAQRGVAKWSDIETHETIYGPSDGFVYFIAIRQLYITHVKIGYTKGSPYARMKGLQTGSPFAMQMLGFVFGCVVREKELHDVLSEERAQGEWFIYSDYAAKIIGHQLTAEYAV